MQGEASSRWERRESLAGTMDSGERDGEETKAEQDLIPLALGSHPGGFTTCATTAFKQLLYTQFCL